MEILVLHPGALGDLILSLPALGILRERIPGARLTLAANVDYAAAIMPSLAGRTLSLSSLPLHRLYGSDPIPPREERLWRSYDRILSWTGSGSELFRRRLEHVNPRVIIAGWIPVSGESRHVTRIFADTLRPWVGVPDDVPAPIISLGVEDRAAGAAWLRDQGVEPGEPIPALHPGAGSPSKRWPLQYFQELARRLDSSGKLLVVEGPAEEGLGRDLAAVLRGRSVTASCLPLPLLASVLWHCRAFVGNDSGVAHLAAALGVPSVVLFGPASAGHWAPLGRHVAVLRASVDCPACLTGAKSGHKCLSSLPVEVVHDRLSRTLAEFDPASRFR